MEMSFMQTAKGFTLIEVLIALAILSIALTAIIKATSQNIKSTLYLENKTIAQWIAVDIINSVRANTLRLPIDDSLTQETNTLGKTWAWEASLITSPNPHIKQIQVDVYQQPEHIKLATMTGYVYAP